jgi:hypothetical protein
MGQVPCVMTDRNHGSYLPRRGEHKVDFLKNPKRMRETFSSRSRLRKIILRGDTHNYGPLENRDDNSQGARRRDLGRSGHAAKDLSACRYRGGSEHRCGEIERSAANASGERKWGKSLKKAVSRSLKFQTRRR